MFKTRCRATKIKLVVDFFFSINCGFLFRWTSLFYGEHDGNRLHGSMESLDTQLHAQDRVGATHTALDFKVLSLTISQTKIIYFHCCVTGKLIKFPKILDD